MDKRGEIDSWLRQVLENEDVKIEDWEIDGSTGKGDGYSGQVTFVRVRVAHADEPMRLAVKNTTPNEFSKLINMTQVYDNEIRAYSLIFPAFGEFAKARGSAGYAHAPRFHGHVTSGAARVLVFDDLRVAGFAMAPRGRTLHRAAVDLVIGAYAELHALSFAMRDQDGARYAELAGALFNDQLAEIVDKMGMDGIFVKHIDESAKLLEANGAASELVEKVKELRSCDLLKKSFSIDDPGAVITHSDGWINNFLFKFKNSDPTKCEEVKVIDWQVCRVASPVMDVASFLVNAISVEDMADLDDILDAYYSTLSRRIRDLGSDPDALYPRDALRRDWSRYAHEAASRFPAMAAFVGYGKDDAPDFSDIVLKDGQGGLAGGITVPVGDPRYVQRILGIMTHPGFKKFL